MIEDRTNFDKTMEYENEVKAALDNLEMLCNRNRIPMFCTLAIKNYGDKTEYKSKVLQPLLYNYALSHDVFTDCTNVLNGFSTYYPAPENDQDEEYLKIIRSVIESNDDDGEGND